MADPQQTTPIPTNMQQAPQTPSQETDFFGGGEDAFQNGAVINPNAEPTPFVPEEKVWEPNITEPSKIEGEELKIEKIEPMDEPVVETMPEPVIEPIVEPVMEPIPEPVIEPVIEPEPIIEQADVRPIIESMPEPIVEPVPAPMVNPIPEIEKMEEKIEEKEEPIIEPITVQEAEPVEVDTDTSDLGKKFMELFHLCTQINERKKTDEGFQLIGADNDTVQILYRFILGDPDFPMVSVTKVEIDKSDDEETTHELNFYFNEEGTSVNVNLDEELLFEEAVDLQEDAKKKMQVMDKLNKFIFLVTEESKKIEKEIKLREAEQEEKRMLQDIFRNF